MSNPSINRWGVNLFWYRVWYVDKGYDLNIHQDSIFSELINLFLFYGLLHPHNIFCHSFWYRNRYFKVRNYRFEHSVKYYRVMNFKNLAMNIDSDYVIRNKTRNVYATKLWIFKFQHWVIIGFYCFQPIIKRSGKNKNTKRYIKEANSYTFSNIKTSYAVKRFKFLIFYFLSIKNINNYYLF